MQPAAAEATRKAPCHTHTHKNDINVLKASSEYIQNQLITLHSMKSSLRVYCIEFVFAVKQRPLEETCQLLRRTV